MPGRLRSSFRGGNVAEDLGLLLLRGIAAVAEVPRPEDVGLDAVASLLRPDPDGNYYAEDSFLVQLKSASVKSVTYHGHELRWLLSQSLPFFIGRVSVAGASISLYPTIYANQRCLETDASEIQLAFRDEGPPKNSGPCDSDIVPIGPPLLEWTVQDLANRDWKRGVYPVLKRYLEVAQHEHALLKRSMRSRLSWGTGDVDSILQESIHVIQTRSSEVQSHAKALVPPLLALVSAVFGLDDPDRPEGIQGLERFLSLLQKGGLQVFDSDGMLRSLIAIGKTTSWKPLSFSAGGAKITNTFPSDDNSDCLPP